MARGGSPTIVGPAPLAISAVSRSTALDAKPFDTTEEPNDHFRFHRLPRRRPTQAAAVPLPLHRRRRLRRVHPAPQRRGPVGHRPASAGAEEHVRAEPGNPPVRRDPGDAGGARPGRSHRHVRPPRRGPGGARGGGEGRALHPVDGIGVPDRGGRPGHRPADVVPALRAEGPRLHAQRPGAGQGRRRHHPGVHRRHAGPRRPLPRRPFRHERPLRRAAPHPASHDHRPGPGTSACWASPTTSATFPPTAATRPDWRTTSAGWAPTSTRRFPGRTWSGSASSGTARW